MKASLKLVFLLTAVLATGAVWSTGFGQDTPTPKALFEKQCSACHTLDRVFSRNETAEGWAKIVKSMRRKSFGKISKADAEAITGYLAANQGPK